MHSGLRLCLAGPHMDGVWCLLPSRPRELTRVWSWHICGGSEAAPGSGGQRARGSWSAGVSTRAPWGDRQDRRQRPSP